ncbi:MAG TPA: DUF4091 domain-containing protein [Candidatus Hydrogenedentes bacterium]|nr:DUF4091 domain-containing protein [Candidatus Hydrogenedentota bacterium]
MDAMGTFLWGCTVCAVLIGSAAARAENIDWWTTHSLDKAFPDSVKPANAPQAIALKAARNDTEDAQVLLRTPKGLTVAKASFSLPDLQGPDGAIIAKSNLGAHWIWYTYVHNNPPANKDPKTFLRAAPGFFPDGFLEQPVVRIRDEWTQPLWVSVTVPKDTPPGDYTGTLGIDLDGQHIDVPVAIHVWAFTLPDEPTLHQTEWFFPANLAEYYRIPLFSDACWTWIDRVAQDMGRHRQDTILTPFTMLVCMTQQADGAFAFDFTALDRWVEMFKKAGVTWIEGGHVAGRCGGWESQFVWSRFNIVGSDGKPLDTGTLSEAEFEPYMEAFLKGVWAHLKEKGWAGRYIQHIADEPIPVNEKSWTERAGKVRGWLPGVPIVDAIMHEGLDGFIDIRVPQIQHIKPGRKENPKEATWSYVCLYPQGEYPNRFLDYPLIRNRILFWLSWSLDLKGFLHWGYGHWKTWDPVPAAVDVSPWMDATGGSIYVADRQPLPAGDPFIVYPGRDKICSSMRWEDIRNGMEDFEYLHMLQAFAKRPPKGMPRADRQTAKALLERVRNEIAKAPNAHTQDASELLNIRDEIGELLGRITPYRLK